jgi:hypothetical protein
MIRNLQSLWLMLKGLHLGAHYGEVWRLRHDQPGTNYPEVNGNAE